MADPRKIQQLPTPNAPLLRGTHVSREWLTYFLSINNRSEDIEALLAYFSTISCPSGEDVIADIVQDTLTLASGSSGLTITGDDTNDLITFELAYEQKLPSVTFTDTDANLTSDHFGKIVKMDNNANHVTCYLPSVGAADVDSWVTPVKLGTGELVIQAADSDVIETSSPGGYLVCDEIERVAANLHLHLVTSTIWMIRGGTGIWKVV